MSALEEELRRLDPARGLDDVSLMPMVSSAWNHTRATASRRGSRKRWKIIVPVGLTVLIVSTGAAVASPLWLGIDDTQVEADMQVAISYTTVSGTAVDCVWAVYVGGADRTSRDDQVAEALSSTNWDGVGQEIYDQATANPVAPQSGETWTNDTPETRDAISFKIAILPVIERRLPPDLQGVASQWGSTDTCNGPFR